MEETCKVVLIGETGVGKTCIINRFIHNNFDPGTISSLSGQFVTKEMEFSKGQTVSLQIWDTAGQEKYRSMAKIFYRDAKAVIMVYDITNENTFNQLKEYWLGQIKKHGSKDVLIAIAANKSDLIEQMKVKNEDGEKFAEEIGAKFILTSAQNADGIQNLFESIARKILEPSFAFSVSEQKKKEDYGKEKEKAEKEKEEKEKVDKEKAEKEKITTKKSIKLNEHDIKKNEKKKCC